MKSDITLFKEQTLEPAIFANEYFINAAFPKMEFKRKGSVYVSPFKRDGSKPRTPRPDKTYIAQKNGAPYVDENGSIGAINLTQYYIEENNCSFIEAIHALAKIAGIDDQVPEPKNKEDFEKWLKSLADNKTAARIMQKALFSGSERATKTLQYIKGRNWTEEEIKNDMALLGHIDTEILQTLPKSVQDSIKPIKSIDLDFHTLVIPIQEGSEIIGFKFRLTDPAQVKKPRYLNSLNLPKKGKLGGIPTTARPYEGKLIIVEGELDALHAKVKGLENVASTLGNKATIDQIEAATARGFRHFIFAYDADEAGQRYFEETAKTAPQFKASVYFVDITNLGVKDLDEYLSQHTATELDKYITDNAKHYVDYRTNSVISHYCEKYNGDNYLPDIPRQEFINEITNILLQTAQNDRILIYNLLEANKTWLRVEPKDIENSLAGQETAHQQAQQLEEQKNITTSILKALEKNDLQGANKLIDRLANSTTTETKEREFAEALTPTPLATLAKGITDGIPTGYYFGYKRENNKEQLTINPGLTFICAPTSHGKTTALNNIALNEAKRIAGDRKRKCVLYFSYEIAKNRIVLDLLNTQINDDNLCEGLRYDNISKELRNALATGAIGFTGQHQTNYYRGLAELQNYWNAGTLRIIDKPYKVGELLQFIDFVRQHPDQYGEISLILIDYVQLLYKEGKFTLRTEELKEIVNDIKEYATDNALPFVLAAQFNRKAVSPASATLDNIGEAGDIERIADTVISLVNLERFAQLKNISKDEKQASIDLLNDAGLRISSIIDDDLEKSCKGKIFAQILKRRNGRSQLTAVLDWNGKTKHLATNNPETAETETTPKEGNIFDYKEPEETPF